MKKFVYMIISLGFLAILVAGCVMPGTGKGILVLPMGNTSADTSRAAPYDWSAFMPRFSQAELSITTSDGQTQSHFFTDPRSNLTFIVPSGQTIVSLRAVPDWAATASGLTLEQQNQLPTLAREYTSNITTNIIAGKSTTLNLRLLVSKTAVLGPKTEGYPRKLSYTETIIAGSPVDFIMGADMYPSTLPYIRFDRFGRLFYFVTPSSAGTQHIVVWDNPSVQPTPLLSSSDTIHPWIPAYDELHNRIYAYSKNNSGELLSGEGMSVYGVASTQDYFYLTSDDVYQPNVITADRSGRLYLVMYDNVNSTYALARATVDNQALAVESARTFAELGIPLNHWIEDMQFKDGYLYLAVATQSMESPQAGFFLKLVPSSLSIASLPQALEAIVPRRFLGLENGRLIFADTPLDTFDQNIETVSTFSLVDGSVVRGSNDRTFLHMYYFC